MTKLKSTIEISDRIIQQVQQLQDMQLYLGEPIDEAEEIIWKAVSSYAANIAMFLHEHSVMVTIEDGDDPEAEDPAESFRESWGQAVRGEGRSLDDILDELDAE